MCSSSTHSPSSGIHIHSPSLTLSRKFATARWQQRHEGVSVMLPNSVTQSDTAVLAGHSSSFAPAVTHDPTAAQAAPLDSMVTASPSPHVGVAQPTRHALHLPQPGMGLSHVG